MGVWMFGDELTDAEAKAVARILSAPPPDGERRWLDRVDASGRCRDCWADCPQSCICPEDGEVEEIPF